MKESRLGQIHVPNSVVCCRDRRAKLLKAVSVKAYGTTVVVTKYGTAHDIDAQTTESSKGGTYYSYFEVSTGSVLLCYDQSSRDEDGLPFLASGS
jgi:hypothetical protein